jgi:hypothetical protein
MSAHFLRCRHPRRRHKMHWRHHFETPARRSRGPDHDPNLDHARDPPRGAATGGGAVGISACVEDRHRQRLERVCRRPSRPRDGIAQFGNTKNFAAKILLTTENQQP